MSIHVAAFSLYGNIAASHRVRLSQYVNYLGDNDICFSVQSLLNNSFLASRFAFKRLSITNILFSYLRRLLFLLFQTPKFDLCFVYAELFPFFPAWLELLLMPKDYIYDFDDAFHLKYDKLPLPLLALLKNKIPSLLSNASVVIAANSNLYQYACSYNKNVILIPSVVDTDLFFPTPSSDRSPPPFIVGWIGSPSTSPYLELLVQPLIQLSKICRLQLLVVGGKPPLIHGVDVKYVPWSADSEVSLIQSFDVGVMPLPDNPWTRCKSSYKLIQCMSCAIPVIASPVGSNVDLITRDTGLLASSPTEWVQSFSMLFDNPAYSRELGLSGRRRVIQYYSLHYSSPLLKDTIIRAYTD